MTGIHVGELGHNVITNVTVMGAHREEVTDVILGSLSKRATEKKLGDVVKTPAGIELRAEKCTIQLRISKVHTDVNVSGIVMTFHDRSKTSSLEREVNGAVLDAVLSK